DICGGGVGADDARVLVTREIAVSCVREGIALTGIRGSLAAPFDRGTVRLMKPIQTLPLDQDTKWRLVSDVSNSIRAIADRFQNDLDQAYEDASQQRLGTRLGNQRALVERLLVGEEWQDDEQVRLAARDLRVRVV